MTLDTQDPSAVEEIRSGRTTVSAFLRQCALRAIDDGTEFELPAEDLDQLRETFIEGGLAALRAAGPPPAWLQYNLGLDGATPDLYGELARFTEELLADDAEDVFFMHKPPGMRFRCSPPEHRRHEFDARCRKMCAGLVRRQLIEHWTPAVYEPEARLFGGTVSMRSVHRLFTADSRVWLPVFASAGSAGPDLNRHWALSLLMIRDMFGALRILGWEDVDVWNRIAEDGGRVLTPEVAQASSSRRLAAALRAGWTDPAGLRATLPADWVARLEEYEQVLPDLGQCWRDEYFHRPSVRVGPRRAAAYAVIFHWNRARFPAHHQALITHFLASRQEES